MDVFTILDPEWTFPPFWDKSHTVEVELKRWVFSLERKIVSVRELRIWGAGSFKYRDRRPKTRHVPGTTYFPSDAERREERPLTELQGVTLEDK